MDTYTVGQLANVAGVSIRTLHHYDAIGLLSPSERTQGGYRVYRHADLEDLQQILLYRELDMPLDAIGRLMLDPTFDRRAALVAQRAQLAGRARRLSAILAAIDAALDALTTGETMNDTDMFEVFGDFEPKIYEAEVKERWGETDAYAKNRHAGRRATRRRIGRRSRPRGEL
jgi:DNA-binding transcriptional MerR regulator